jgi:hypothetical protein
MPESIFLSDNKANAPLGRCYTVIRVLTDLVVSYYLSAIVFLVLREEAKASHGDVNPGQITKLTSVAKRNTKPPESIYMRPWKTHLAISYHLHRCTDRKRQRLQPSPFTIPASSPPPGEKYDSSQVALSR